MTGSTVVEPAGPGPRRPGRPVTAPVPQVRPRHPPAAERSATGRGDPGGTALLDVPDADAVPVLAVLVAHDGAAWLPRALAAVARSTRRPDVLVAVDTGSVDGSRDLLAAAGQVAGVVSLPRTASPGEAVAAGVALAREALAASWVPPTGRRARAAEPLVWILHDDCAPAPEALEMLLGAVVAAPTVAVAGCKLVGWDDPGELVEVGVTVSPTGRRMTGLAPGERDQGQHDSRSDVLAVSTAGALVRWDVVESVGAFDPAIPLAGDDIDLCRRVRAAGHRVVVVPSARCRHAAALETGVRAGDALLGPRAARRRRGPAGPRLRGHRRRHALYSRVVAAGPWRVLPTLAWLFLEVLGHAAFLLADRRPLAAAGEVAAWWSVASTPWRVAAGWRRAGPTRASGRAAVRRLQPSAVRLAVDRLDQAVGEAARRAVTARPHPVLLVTAAVAVVAAVPARLQVPAAAGAGTDAGIRTVAAAGLTAGELWRRTAAGAVPPDPATAVWAVLSGAAALVTGRAPQDGTLAAAAAWVGWAAVPLAVLTAWALVREVSAGRRAGPLLAVAWAAVPGLAAAAGVGYAATTDERLVHALAPLPVWALAVVLRRRAVPWLGAGVAVGGVAAVVVVALQPAAWPLLVAAGLGTAAAVLGRRVGPARSWRLLAVATVSAAPAVAFPAWAVTAWSSPLVVLLAPAHRDGAPVLQAWREGAWVADDAASGVALAGLAVVAAAGLAGAGLGVLRAPVARTAVAAAVALASWAVVAGAVTADLPGGRTRALDPVWAAPLLAVLVAAAAGATRRRARPTGRRLAAVVAAVVAAGAVGWAAVGVVVTVPAAAGLPVPAAVDAASPAGLATLTLTVSAPADTGPTVTWALDRGQPGPGTDATAAQVAGPPPAAVEDLVTDLLGGAPAADAAADGGTSVDGRGGRVGWVVVDGPDGTAAPVVAAVGARSGLEEVARVPGRVVWRVERDDPPTTAPPVGPVGVLPLWQAAVPWLGGALVITLLVVAVGRRPDGAAAPGGRPGAPAPAVVAATTVAVGVVATLVVVATGLPDRAPDPPRAVTLATPGERAVCPGDTAAVPVATAGDAVADAPAAGPTDEVTGVDEAVTGDPPRSGVQGGVLTGGVGEGAAVLAACPSAVALGYGFTGGSAPGRRPRLVLANPGDVPAGASVDLLTPTGRVAGGAAGALTVPPGAATALAVDALGVADGVTAVEVRAERGAVAGTLRDTAVAGLRPAGTDDEALSPAGTRLVVPVVTVPGTAADATGTAGAVVALAVPGDAGGVARVRVSPTTDGDVGGDAGGDTSRGPDAVPPVPSAVVEEAVPLVPGGTAVLALPRSGTWAVWIESDVPVAAAARSVRVRADGALDVGWAAAVPPGDVNGAVVPLPAPPAGATIRLHLATEAGAVLDLDLLDASGAVGGTRRVTVPAAGTVAVDAGASGGEVAAVRVRAAPRGADSGPGAGGAVTGAVGISLVTADGLATTTVPARAGEATVVRVLPR